MTVTNFEAASLCVWVQEQVSSYVGFGVNPPL